MQIVKAQLYGLKTTSLYRYFDEDSKEILKEGSLVVMEQSINCDNRAYNCNIGIIIEILTPEQRKALVMKPSAMKKIICMADYSSYFERKKIEKEERSIKTKINKKKNELSSLVKEKYIKTDVDSLLGNIHDPEILDLISEIKQLEKILKSNI